MLATGLLLLAVGSCAGQGTTPGGSSAPTTTPAASLIVTAMYVPVCGPSDPRASTCPPRRLSGVVLSLTDDDGEPAGIGTTDSTGQAGFALPEGVYVVRGSVVPDAVTPRPVTVTVTGRGRAVTVVLTYDSNLQ